MFKSNKYNPDIEHDRAVESLRQGSAEAFQFLYQKYHNKVYRFCFRLLGSEQAAKDAFQETFIKVYEKRKTFNGENFSAWLFTIARHTCYNMMRAKKEHSTFDETFHAKRMTPTTDFGLKKALESAIEQLSDNYKEAFILREYEELTYEEIAEILDIELSLAKIRVFRARRKLRKILKPIIQELDEHR